MHSLRLIVKFIWYGIDQIFSKPSVPPEKLLKGDSKISIVILQGGFAKDYYFMYKELADQLSLDGYKVFFVPGLGYNIKDFPTSARIVRDLIIERDLKKIVLIGHSKGGLIGKYYLQYFNADGRVLNLIAISTPFAGVPFARYLIYKRFSEFSPNSVVIKNLTSYTKENSKIYSLIPAKDIIIKNIDSMRVEGGKNIYLKTEGHLGSVNSPEAISWILKILKETSIKN